MEQGELVGLITRRSQVQILPPLPHNHRLKRSETAPDAASGRFGFSRRLLPGYPGDPLRSGQTGPLKGPHKTGGVNDGQAHSGDRRRKLDGSSRRRQDGLLRRTAAWRVRYVIIFPDGSRAIRSKVAARRNEALVLRNEAGRRSSGDAGFGPRPFVSPRLGGIQALRWPNAPSAGFRLIEGARYASIVLIHQEWEASTS